MTAIRTRQRADGTCRYEINYSHRNRTVCVTFDDLAEAEAFAHVVELRARRWPLRPLVERTGLTSRQLAEAHGLGESGARKLARNGLTDVQADQWATEAGLHPAQVWGWDWITAALPDSAVDGEAVA